MWRVNWAREAVLTQLYRNKRHPAGPHRHTVRAQPAPQTLSDPPLRDVYKRQLEACAEDARELCHARMRKLKIKFGLPLVFHYLCRR